MNTLIRTLIVDDSAFVRKVVRQILSRSPFIEVVGAARDAEEALELVEQLRPDVVTCDLQMPGLGGVGFVREQMARRPLPILILTAAPEDAAPTLEAMDAGAVDFIKKPTALANDDLLQMRELLVEKVKEAAAAVVTHVPAESAPVEAIAHAHAASRCDVVVLGISTGGPQALRYLLPQFPADFPVPIAIVIHMPVGYTQLFAQKLGEISKLTVREAREGDRMVPGTALIAQAGRHMVFRRNDAGTVQVAFTMHPLDLPHRPAADVLFRSAAEVYGSRVLAVVMTGMGYDGKQGSAWIKAQGGTVLTEAEQSCVIYGMPRSVVEAGLSDGVVPLEKMTEAIINHI